MDFDTGLVNELYGANYIVVLTGAGISAESGIPTFRDKTTGLWQQYNVQELATPQGFRNAPGHAWEWYLQRRQCVLEAQPNAGHVALAELEKYVHQVTVITQNINDLHERAGSTTILHLHGSMMHLKCFGCPRTFTWDESMEQQCKPPECPDCKEWLRPATVMFNESLPVGAMDTAMEAIGKCDLLLVIGTSGTVYPAASLPEYAHSLGITVVEINTEVSKQYTYELQGRRGEILPQLIQSVFK